MTGKNELLKAIILAAGKGKRFKSDKPKVLHEVLGKPMLFYISLAVKWTNPSEIIYIVGHKKDEVIKYINCDGCKYVYQDEQLGTGDAVRRAEKYFKDFDGLVLIINGDMPLIEGETLKNAVKFVEALIRYEGAYLNDFRGYKNENVAGAVITTQMPNPFGYGRVIKDKEHKIIKIVEEKDATEKEKGIKEVNVGVYVFVGKYLAEALKKISNNNNQKEFYLTDVIDVLNRMGKDVYALEHPDYIQFLGVNNRWELAQAEDILRKKYLSFWAINGGATIHMPETVWIEFDVDLSKDVEIFQNVVLKGETKIGEGTVIEPNCIIKNSSIGKNVKILANSVIEDSVIEDNAVIGPFARIRNNAVIGENSQIGNFVEVKNSQIGKNTFAKHLSYLGDAEIGDNVNIGAGSITCNYDGIKKHKTVIKDGAFIGSDTMLVAPITVGENAMTGSGSVITKDVPDNALAIERNQQKIIPDYVIKRKKKNK